MTPAGRALGVRLGRVAARARQELYAGFRRRAEPVRRALGRRRRAPVAVRFMDYGPDWPPAPSPAPAPPRHPLLRQCAAIIAVYVVIWALGAVLLDLRLRQLHEVSGNAVTTYTTIDH